MLRDGMIHGHADRCINARRKELRKCMINWGRRVRGKVRGCETRYEEEQRAMAGWRLMYARRLSRLSYWSKYSTKQP